MKLLPMSTCFVSRNTKKKKIFIIFLIGSLYDICTETTSTNNRYQTIRLGEVRLTKKVKKVRRLREKSEKKLFFFFFNRKSI